MGPWAHCSGFCLKSFVVLLSLLSLSAVAAPWNSSTTRNETNNSNSLEAILQNAGRQMPAVVSLPSPAPLQTTDLFSLGSLLTGPLTMATQQLAPYPSNATRSSFAAPSELSRRLRPQFQVVDVPKVDRPHQWLIHSLGVSASTAQQQRQQPQQEGEMAAATVKLAKGIRGLGDSMRSQDREALESMALSLQDLRVASGRSAMRDDDRTTLNQLTAMAAKSVEEMEVSH